MAVLSTKISIIDDASAKLNSICTATQDVKQNLDSIGTTSSSLDKITQSTDKSNQSFSEGSSKIQEYTAKQEEGKQAVNDFAKGVDNSSQELDKYASTTNSATEAEEKLNNSQTQVQENMKETSKSTKETEEETENYKSTTEATFESLGKLIAAAGIVAFLKEVKDGFLECDEAAETYGTTVAKVSTISDTDVWNKKQIASDTLSLSMDTGKNANDLGEAEYQALSAGVASDKASNFVNTANQLAVGGFTEQATAVDILTTAINAYNKSAEDASNISDILVTTQNLGKTTVNELANSMGRVIPSASAYNVSLEDLSTSYAVLTANGMNTRYATTYITAMLNELADSGSTVSEALQEKTGKSFSDLESSGMNLGEVLNILYESVGKDSTAFSNLWSSAQAGTGALSLANSGIEKYNSVLNSMENSTGATSKAFETMENTAEHSTEAFENSCTNLKIAIGNALTPSTSAFKDAMTKVINSLTTFVTNNPQVVRAITAITTAAGVLVAGITAYTVASKLAKIATVAFTAVMDANPIFLVATAIAAVVSAVATFAFSQEEATEPVEKMSLATQKQEEKISSLKESYKELQDAGKGNSAQAYELKEKITELEQEYDSSKQTLDEFTESIENTSSQYKSTMDSHQQSLDKIKGEAEETSTLTKRLEKLGSQSKLTAGEQAEMQNIIDILNQKMPSLGLTYDNVSKNIKGSIKEINKAINEDLVKDSYDEAYSGLKDATGNKSTITKQFKEAEAQWKEADRKMQNYKAQLNGAKSAWDDESWFSAGKYLNWNGGTDAENAQKAIDDYQAEYDKIKEAYETAKGDFDKNKSDIENYQNELQEINANSLGLDLNTSNEAQQGVNDASLAIKSSLDDLAEAYDNAYSSAYDSFSGQYKLWDDVKVVSATSVTDVESNLQSQINYWNEYNNNLSTLDSYSTKVKGLNDVLKQLDDGSEKSAGILKGMANSVQNGDTSGLQELVNKYQELNNKQKSTSETYAKVETDFNNTKNSIVSSAEDAVDKLNLSSKAAKSAKSTMNAYIEEITNSSSAISGAMKTALEGAKATLQVTTTTKKGKNGKSTVDVKVEGNAKGTDYSSDVFVAGEEGPELIVGKEGSKVYTAEETKDIFARTNQSVGNTSIVSTASSDEKSSDKVITVRLEGIGSIQVTGNSGKISNEKFSELLAKNLVPVISGIVSEETFEEGDGSYDY